MKIKKSTIQKMAQYLCDINEFGFEDDNIDSIQIWAEKAQELLYKLQKSDADYLIGMKNKDQIK